jgi:hypothetical protein
MLHNFLELEEGASKMDLYKPVQKLIEKGNLKFVLKI